MTNQTEHVLRLDAKLASIAKNGRTALVCFYVRGQGDELTALAAAKDTELLLGIVVAREAATPGGDPPN